MCRGELRSIMTELTLGCLSKPINEQLDEQNIQYDLSVIAVLEIKHKTLCKLKFMDLFPPGQINKAYDKLFKQVEKHLKEDKIKE